MAANFTEYRLPGARVELQDRRTHPRGRPDQGFYPHERHRNLV